MKETKNDNDSVIAWLLLAYLLNENKDLIDKLQSDFENINSNDLFVLKEREILGNEKYKQYSKEVEEYTLNFCSINNCSKYMPHTEYKEYYEGLNNIRIKYGLGKLIQTECKCGGYGYLVDENDLKEQDND